MSNRITNATLIAPARCIAFSQLHAFCTSAPIIQTGGAAGKIVTRSLRGCYKVRRQLSGLAVFRILRNNLAATQHGRPKTHYARHLQAEAPRVLGDASGRADAIEQLA